MSKKMLINATHPEENRVAIVEHGVLTELGIEVAGREPTKGNIYKAAVVRVESGLQAAFVDYGAERLGFLQIDEINAAVVKPDHKGGSRPRISDLLHRGQEILVQIVKEERGTKGAALTTYLSLAGRYMVLMPGTPTRGVSRKAEDDKQRKQMKKALSTLDLPENVGCIVRTAALDQTREELERDYSYLMRLYENIQTLEKKVKAPALIYKESNLVIRSIRDYFTTDMDEVLIDDPEVYREAREFFETVMPDHLPLVKLHQERRPIFSRYQIEEQIETISRNKVPLPSGGSIVIDITEALVAIDVNSGKMAGETNVESTATRTNLEAAEEVARQLRLRDLGGLIVVDFIDMRERKHNRQVEERLRDATARDKARITVGHISQFGMLEMSRQRIKPALTEGIYRVCPHCQGAGRIRGIETLAVSILRRLHAGLAKGQIAQAEVQSSREVASFLLNEKREELVEMERRYQADIQITGRTSFLADQVELTLQKREKEKAAAEFVEARIATMSEKPVRPAEKPAAGEPPPVAVPELPELPVEAGDEQGATDEAGKKKRRRRKKKSGRDGGPAEGAAPATEEHAAEGDEHEAEDAPATAPADGSAPAKKKRRRRGRKKKGGAESGAGAETAADRPQAAAVAEEMPAPADDDAPAKKKHRPRGRKKGTASEAVAPAPVEAPAPAAAPEATPAKPPRKPAAAKAKPAKPVVPDEPAGPAAGSEPAKRKRTPRKPAADAAPAGGDAEAPAPARRKRAPRQAKPAASDA